MTPSARLVEQDALHRLKARYFRLYDTKDWDGWLSLFIEDATLTADYHVRGERPLQEPLRLVGKAEIRDFIVPRASSRRTVHHGHTPEIELLSEDEASGIWAMEDIIDYADRRVHGHGHYHERYRKIAGEWRFAEIHLTRLRLVAETCFGTGLSK